jgi:GMP synthase-like glutamine amidotransferase/DNA-binding CsgD family transcriptional regulator
MRALALEHLDPNPVGVYGDVLDARGVAVDRVQLHAGHVIPDWRDYDLLIVMGAGQSVWEEDEHPWIAEEKRLVREAVPAGVPYFGVCFGAQMLASAFGGRGYRGLEPELGINQVFLTAAARRDPVFRGFPLDLEVCEWHTNHFELPAGGVRLARSPRYENQAVRLGRVAYGIQCHLETTRTDLEEWLELFPDTVGQFEARHGRGSLSAFLDDYGRFTPRLRETARQLFGRWLQHALAHGRPAGARPATLAPAADAGELLGRDAERARVDRALEAARQGGSAVLAIRGEAGAGKTAVLDHAAARAAGLRVLRTRGSGQEAEPPFAGLADLCRPLLDHLPRLSPARAAVLRTALDLPGEAGDAAVPAGGRYAVLAGALDLLCAAADDSPLLVLVDDAHLLDAPSAEAVFFLARRLWLDGIALLVATEAEDPPLEAEELRLGPLDAAHSRALLAARFGDALAPPVAERVLAEARGSPLALLEIPRDLSPEARRDATAIGGSLPPSAEWAYLRRIEALPPVTRRALLVAALAGTGAETAVDRSVAAWGLPAGALAPAEAAGLIRRDAGRVRFCHELARTAVSYSALSAERRAAHAALAATLDGEHGLWHAARAAHAPDERVARGLEEVAARARAHGAFAAAADALERAARLTEDGDGRARRLLGAAECARAAGHVHMALDHLGAALECAVEPALRIALEHARGRLAARSGAASQACAWLVAAAARSERDDPAKAAAILADAVLPALRAGSPAEAVRLARRAAVLAERGGDDASPATLMLGTALVFAGEYEQGVALLEAVDRAGGPPDPRLGGALAAAGLHARAREVLGDVVSEAREAGAVDMLPYALVRLAGVALDTGRWRAASVDLAEAASLAEETGSGADRGLALGTLAWLDAAQGRTEACCAHVREALELADRLGAGSRLDRAAAAVGLLELGRNRPAAAIGPLEDVLRVQLESGWTDAALAPHHTPELVEAYARAGRAAEARAAGERFRAEAERTRRPSALALAARCDALVAGNADLDARFAACLEATAAAAGPFEHARTMLLYGSRLAAADRVPEALPHLVAAVRAFDALGAVPWAARARAAIASAGGVAPPLHPAPADRLTALEREVAVAAAGGAVIGDVARRVFLGPRTARILLAAAMVKLGAESSHELAGLLGTEA